MLGLGRAERAQRRGAGDERLPDAAEAPRVSKSDADSDAILRIAVKLSRRTADDLTSLFREFAERSSATRNWRSGWT